MVAEILVWISSTAGAFGIAAGCLLLLAPGALREGSRWRRWLLEVDLASLLDARRTIERPLYRHHRVFGAVVIAGALAWLVPFWMLRDRLPAVGDFAAIAILAGCVLVTFALGIGFFLVVRPSALKGLEAAANRWIEPFPLAGKPGEPSGYEFVNRVVLRVPRLTGLLLLATGLGCLALSR